MLEYSCIVIQNWQWNNIEETE